MLKENKNREYITFFRIISNVFMSINNFSLITFYFYSFSIKINTFCYFFNSFSFQVLCQYIQMKTSQKSTFNRSSFQKNGFAVIRHAFDSNICELAIKEAQRMKNQSGFNQPKGKQNPLFRSHFMSKFQVDNNKVSYFFGDMNKNDPHFRIETLIKIGHSLHLNKVFKEITYSKVVKQVTKALDIEPLVVQSMILQKLPEKGGIVQVHQDSTYLFTEPESIIGWWIPLQNVTQQNGCIWVLPESHKGKLYTQFKIIDRQPVYEQLGQTDYQENDFVPIQMEKGDLLIFSGKLLHKSHQNFSEKPRHAYSWHTMDKNSKWGQNNWRSFDEVMDTQIDSK